MALALSWKGQAVLGLLALSAAAAVVAATHDFAATLPGLAAQAVLAVVVFAATLLRKGGGRLIGARIVIGLIAGVKVVELGMALLR